MTTRYPIDVEHYEVRRHACRLVMFVSFLVGVVVGSIAMKVLG